jgi:hypothetical protein
MANGMKGRFKFMSKLLVHQDDDGPQTAPVTVLALQDKESMHENRAKALINSLARHKHKPLILDSYDKSLGTLGLLSKIFKVHDYLVSNERYFLPDSIIVFVDAHDVILRPSRGHPLHELRADFLQSGLDFILGAEQRCAHQLPEVEEFFNGQVNQMNKFPNTGFQVGRYRTYIKLYGYLIQNIRKYHCPNLNDQGVMGQFIRNQVVYGEMEEISIGLDHSQNYVKTLNSISPFVPEEITSYFIHVTWLANPNQKQKFKDVLEYYVS